MGSSCSLPAFSLLFLSFTPTYAQQTIVCFSDTLTASFYSNILGTQRTRVTAAASSSCYGKVLTLITPITGEGKQSCLSRVSFFCNTARPFIFCVSAASVSELLFKSLTQKSAELQQQTLRIVWHLLRCEWGCAWFTIGRALPNFTAPDSALKLCLHVIVQECQQKSALFYRHLSKI